MKNFGDDYTDEQLKETFSQFGKVISAKVMTDHNTGRGRGFGFVSYEDHEGAAKVSGTSFSTCTSVILSNMNEE